jgi:polyhydroxyalkanoate synthesis regulator phasin
MRYSYGFVTAVVVSLSLNVMIAYGIEDKNDVKENNMINELIKSGKFTEDEARELVTKSMQNEQKDSNNQTKTEEPKGVFKSKAFTVKDLKTVKLDNRYEIQGTI